MQTMAAWSDWTRTKTQRRKHDPAWARLRRDAICVGLGLLAGVGWCVLQMGGAPYCGWPW